MLKKEKHLLFLLLKPVHVPILVAVIFQIFGSLSIWISYGALVAIADGLARHDPAHDMYRALGWFVTGLGLQSGLKAIALSITHFADAHLQHALRHRLVAKLGRLPIAWFRVRTSGEIRQMVQNDVDALHQLVAHSLIEGVAFVCTPLVGLAFCFTLDWRLGIAACVPLVLYFLIFSLLSPGNMHAIMSHISACLSSISGVIVDYFRGVAVLKVFGRAGEGYGRFTQASQAFHHDFSALVRPAMKAQAVAVTVIAAPAVALVMAALGIPGVASGWMSAADVMVAATIAMLLPASIMTVTLADQIRSAAEVAAARITSLLNEPELPDANARVVLGHGAVTLRNVTFDYGKKRVLDGVSLTLSAGSLTALAGPSGAGKSTLAALICRHHDVLTGQICIDGHDIRDIPLAQLYGMVGILEQTPTLPALSLARNIALGMEHVSLAEIREAARAALIDDRIMAMPRGYDSIPGVHVRLSGGEAQRVAIARLILAGKPILIMDEATSAIDPDAKVAIRQAIANLSQGRTTLVIAHHLSTIKNAAQIAVLDQGHLSQVGDHRTLLDLDGLYARMWQPFCPPAEQRVTAA